MRDRGAVIGGMLVLALMGAGLVSRNRSTPTPAQLAITPPTVATSEVRTVSFSITLAGEITPAEQVSVRPEINGRIERMFVDVGATVKKGELLFSLDDHDLQIEIESRQTEVLSANLEFEQAQRDHGRNKELFGQSLVPKESFEKSKTALDLAQALNSRAEKALALARERLTKTRIAAPFDCTVLTRPVSVGQAVSGSGGFNSGTEVLTIADLNIMVVNLHVNQADLPRVKCGREVEVLVDGLSAIKITGVVERISPQALIKNNIRGFPARVLLKSVPAGIQPGMTATVVVPVASATNVVAVPLVAVFSDLNDAAKATEHFVYAKNGSRFERRQVQVGATDLFYAQVEKGLAAGEVVSLVKPENAR